jgi:hypothetical protein
MLESTFRMAGVRYDLADGAAGTSQDRYPISKLHAPRLSAYRVRVAAVALFMSTNAADRLDTCV